MEESKELPASTEVVDVEQKSMEDIQREQREELDKFLNDPENKKNAFGMAQQVLELAGKNWFTVLRFQRVTGLSQEVAIQKLQFLKLFGLAQLKFSKFGKETKPEFKVTLTPEARISAIDEAIKWHEASIRQLNEDKAKIK